MDKTQRRKLEMFRRVWNCGIGNRDAFPEFHEGGKARFGPDVVGQQQHVAAAAVSL